MRHNRTLTRNDVEYLEARERAEYHRWAALRSQTCAGNDPVTGKAKHYSALWNGEGRVAHTAMAVYWLGVARKLRS